MKLRIGQCAHCWGVHGWGHCPRDWKPPRGSAWEAYMLSAIAEELFGWLA